MIKSYEYFEKIVRKLLIFSILVLISGFYLNDTFADHSQITIVPASGSGAPGCEETADGCYIPSTATIDVGGTVIFSNTDSAAHTFTSGIPVTNDGVFDTSLLMVGSTFEWTPTEAGEQPYYCRAHPWMTGIITVESTSPSVSSSITTSNQKISLREHSSDVFNYKISIPVSTGIIPAESGDMIIDPGVGLMGYIMLFNEDWSGYSDSQIISEFLEITSTECTGTCKPLTNPTEPKITQIDVDHKKVSFNYNFQDDFSGSMIVFKRTNELHIAGNQIWTIQLNADQELQTPESNSAYKRILDSFKPVNIRTVENTVSNYNNDQEIEEEINQNDDSKTKEDEVLTKTFRTIHNNISIEINGWEVFPIDESEDLLAIYGKILNNKETEEQKDLYYTIPIFWVNVGSDSHRESRSELKIFDDFQVINYQDNPIYEQKTGTEFLIPFKIPHESHLNSDIDLELARYKNISMSSFKIEDGVIGNVKELKYGGIYDTLEELMSKINRGEILKLLEPDEDKIVIKKIELMSQSNKDLLIINLEITPENELGFGIYNDERLYAIEELVPDDLILLGEYRFNTYSESADETGDWDTYSNTFTEDITFLGTEKKGNKDWDAECPVYFGKTIQAGITDNIKYCFEIPKNVNYFIYKENIFSKDALKSQSMFGTSNTPSNGGGCLIATATFDSELAPQVQKLREIRDSKLLSTESGSQFMEHFNTFYYSFSPIIADYERENPVFKELIRAGITPMLSTLSLMDYAESESEVLGIGISLIILNGIMYVGLPVFGIIIAKKR